MKYQIGDVVRFISYCRYCNNYYGAIRQGRIKAINQERQTYSIQTADIPSFVSVAFAIKDHSIIQKLNI